jgi:thioredoxin 1
MTEYTKTITDATFEIEVLRLSEPVLVDFWAEWCPPCRMMEPVIQSVAERYQGKVRVLKLNVDENPSVAQRFGIKGIPTLIIFRGGKEAERLVGASSEQTVAQLIERHLNSIAARAGENRDNEV